MGEPDKTIFDLNENEVEEFSIILANRMYLHKLFHVIFGAVPDENLLNAVESSSTKDALERMIQYSTRLGQAAENSLDDAKKVFSDMVRAIEKLCSYGSKEERIALLKSSYTTLFEVPGDSYVHPWESPYIGKEKMLFQESTLDVRASYAKYGYIAAEYKHFPEDHVAMMLNFLSLLSKQAYESFCEGNDENTLDILKFQDDFTQRHLLNWLSQFCEKLKVKDSEGFYWVFSEAMLAFLNVDNYLISEAITKK